jgi:hypothetical protein
MNSNSWSNIGELLDAAGGLGGVSALLAVLITAFQRPIKKINERLDRGEARFKRLEEQVSEMNGNFRELSGFVRGKND